MLGTIDTPGRPQGLTPAAPATTALVLAGGIALGAYEAGAYAAMHERPELHPGWIAGSSIGAVTAALIAGAAPERRLSVLQEFWSRPAWPGPWSALQPDALWAMLPGPLAQLGRLNGALLTLLLGRPGLFQPRLAPGAQAGVQDVPALLDLAPLRDRLRALVDFDLLNSGRVRVTLCCTDVLTGERVVFDTGRGDRIGVEHVLASSALLPLFAPIDIDGRLLGDGCLSANAPADLVLDESGGGLMCFVVELFAPAGSRPHTLAASASRALDLAFGNQTTRILEGRAREDRLRGLIAELAARLPAEAQQAPEVLRILAEGRAAPSRVTRISYRAGTDEIGAFKGFDFSPAAVAERWNAGAAAMADAMAEMQP